MRNARGMGAFLLVVFLYASVMTLTGCDSGKPAQGTGGTVKDAAPVDTNKGGMTSEDYNKSRKK